AADLVVLTVNSEAKESIALLRTVQQPRRVPVLLMGSGPERQQRVEALRSGADDSIQMPFGPDELLAKVRSLLLRFPPQDGSIPGVTGRILAFYSAKGGVGSTTLLLNSAISLHRDLERRVVVVDGKLQFGDVRVFLDLGLHHRSMIDLVTAPSIDADLISKVVIHHDSGLDVLLSPPSPESAELVTQEHLAQILRLLRGMYDYVIV